MKATQAAALAALVLAAPAAAQTAPDTFRLGTIVVTATKVATPLSAVPAHVTVLDADALRALGSTRVVEALRDAAGITVARLGAPGAVTSLFLRGGESDYVQVLVDGVQVNDPGGAYDWAHLTTADVERIEIVRGAGSVLYGSDAVSGVVQIFTRRGTGAPRVQAELAAGSGRRVGAGAEGSYHVWNGSAGVAGGAHLRPALDASYSLGAARQESDGAYAFNNEYRNTTLAARFALAHAGGAHAALTTRYTDQAFHYPTDGAGNLVDHNRYTHGESLSAALQARWPLAAMFALNASLGTYRNRTGGIDPEDEPGQGFANSSADVTRDAAELRLDAEPLAALTLSAGAELERQHGATTFASDGPFGPYSSESADRRGSRALFAQAVHAGRTLGVTLGGRVDDSDQFGSFATARAGASVQLGAALRLHAAYGTGFKEPTFFETYATGFARGNPALEPEQARSTELGVRVQRGGAHVALNGFDQRFRNLIQYTAAPAAPELPNYYNVGEARARGIEAQGGWRLHARWRADASYTWLDTEVLAAGFGEDRSFLEGRTLLRRPAHQGSATLAWQPAEAVRAALSARYVGARDDLDFTDPAEWQGQRVRMPAHTTLDAHGSYRIKTVELVLRAENVLAAEYAEVYNFPAPGRLVTIGVRAGY